MCNDKTFSIQIVATGPDLHQIQVPIFGKHRCSLVAVWFYSAAAGVDLIRLNSPQFRLKASSAVSYLAGGSLNSELSSQPYPVFLSTPNSQIGGLNGSVEWTYDFQGTIELQVENLSGVIIEGDFCVMTISLVPIHE